MEVLPARITDADSLERLGAILRVRPTPQDTGELRLSLFAKDFSWQRLVDFAAAHGVLMPCIFALKQRGLLLPVPQAARRAGARTHATAALEDAYAQHLRRRGALCGQLTEVVAALNRHEVVPLLIKGARFLTDNRPSWSEARDMRDIDIVIPRASGAAAVAALSSDGYAVMGEPGPTDQHLPEMQRPDRFFSVELHVDALGYAGRRLLPTDHLWAVSVPGALEGLQLRVLPPAWHLLHALMHHQVSDRGYARRVLAIKDVWEFAHQADALAETEWRTIADHMRGAGADLLGSFIAQAEFLFGLSPPASFAPSPTARAHAEATLRRARSPDWLRSSLFVADKLGFAFAPQTLAARYPDAGGNPLAVVARHVGYLLRLHGGDLLRRMSGK